MRKLAGHSASLILLRSLKGRMVADNPDEAMTIGPQSPLDAQLRLLRHLVLGTQIIPKAETSQLSDILLEWVRGHIKLCECSMVWLISARLCRRGRGGNLPHFRDRHRT